MHISYDTKNKEVASLKNNEATSFLYHRADSLLKNFFVIDSSISLASAAKGNLLPLSSYSKYLHN